MSTELKHKVGDEMYIPSAMYISRGSDDRVGGLATIKEFRNNEMVVFCEFPNTVHSYEYLLTQQDELKKQFGNNKAYPDPDIDTPWIQNGDIVNGQPWTKGDVW